MRPINYLAFILVLCLLHNGVAKGQNQSLLRSVYHVEKNDGTVLIVAENHGGIPFTALIRAKLVNMRSSMTLPFRIVVHPGEKPFLLATFTPTATGKPSWNYTYRTLTGIYTGHIPDTSYVYRLPYYPTGIAGPIIPKKATAAEVTPNTYNNYLYSFHLPINTPICAARAGTVAIVSNNQKNSVSVKNNAVYVLHSDGSYATYGNLQKNSVIGQPGRLVATGDTLGYFGGNKLNPFFWFSVHYPADSLITSIPVLFQIGQRIVRPQ